jgi:hypothetical protein
MIDADGQPLPTVVIDASDWPAVADLGRVHAIEGIGDIRTEAVRLDDVLLIQIKLSVPVRASFGIAFDVHRHREMLDDVVSSGSLVIAHTDPQLAAIDQPQWLALDIDSDALAACLPAV